MKKIIPLMMLLVLYMMSTIAFADIDNGTRDYDKIPVESKEMLDKIEHEKENLINWLNTTTRTLEDGVYKTLSVPVFEQENGYYCGPATLKAVVHYYKGVSEDQQTYASSAYLNTDTYQATGYQEMRDCLNSYGKSNAYVSSYNNLPSIGIWFSQVEYNMVHEEPIVMPIKTVGISEFPYDTYGHYLAISAINSKYSVPAEVRLVDPHYDYSGTTWYDYDVVYEANSIHEHSLYIY